jgi:hypothetical protein
MSTTRESRRSRSVPLSLVPALAAVVGVACSQRSPIDPCEAESYSQVACETAIANHGYWNNGHWYAHAYPFASMYYLSRYNSYIAGGGRVRSVSPSVYVPHAAIPSRPGVVRGGFGGIGVGHGAAGS